jgi:phosphotransferase system HPr (HPr) family protein
MPKRKRPARWTNWHRKGNTVGVVTAELKVRHEKGLHARPAAQFLQTAGAYEATIKIRNVSRDTPFKNAKSMLEVMSLQVRQGHVIALEAEGSDAPEAIQAITELIESNFSEDGAE